MRDILIISAVLLPISPKSVKVQVLENTIVTRVSEVGDVMSEGIKQYNIMISDILGAATEGIY